MACCSCCSVAKSCLTLCDPHGLQHIRLPCPSLFPGVWHRSLAKKSIYINQILQTIHIEKIVPWPEDTPESQFCAYISTKFQICFSNCKMTLTCNRSKGKFSGVYSLFRQLSSSLCMTSGWITRDFGSATWTPENRPSKGKEGNKTVSVYDRKWHSFW